MIPKPPKRKREPVKVYSDGREVLNTKTAAGRLEYQHRTFLMAERQNHLCGLCGLFMGDDRTFDHQHGRGMNGSRRDDRIEVNGKRFNAAVHGFCNAEKGCAIRAYKVQ